MKVNDIAVSKQTIVMPDSLAAVLRAVEHTLSEVEEMRLRVQGQLDELGEAVVHYVDGNEVTITGAPGTMRVSISKQRLSTHLTSTNRYVTYDACMVVLGPDD